MEEFDKKRKRQEDIAVADSSNKKKESNEQNAKETSSSPPVRYSSLQRPNGQGMKPKSILMGIYGPRGEKIRHVVHEGALALPESAIAILQETQTTCQRNGATLVDSFPLPAIDGVVRPCLDNENAKSIVITELSSEERPPPPPPPQPVVTMVMGPHGQLVPSVQQPPPQQHQPIQPQEKWQTTARNWKLKLPSCEDNVQEERIRGGGDDGREDDDDVEMTDAPSKDETAETGKETQTTTAATTANAMEVTADQAASTTSAPSTSAGQAAAPDAVVAPEASTSSDAKPAESLPTLTATTTTAPTATTPTPVTSTAPDVSSCTLDETQKIPAVIPLPKKPDEQWQQHVPPPNDEMHSDVVKTPNPSWFDSNSVSDLERTMLPEWFDGSATHRTADTYKQARNKIMFISNQLKQRNLTATSARRTIPGDAGSLLRLHKFLTTWGLINEDAINDSAPTAPGMRENAGSSSSNSYTTTTTNSNNKSNIVWDESSREELMEAVVEAAASSKKRKTSADDETSSLVHASIDWNVVSKRVGNGATATECEKVFLALPLEAAAEKVKERSITPDVSSSERIEEEEEEEEEKTLLVGNELLKNIIESAHPEVVKAATDAALAATNDVSQAQKAGLLALVASEAAGRAKKEEETVSRLLAELQEQRLQKLENRMALLDDVEGILEAERVALELERRDLYTARCRHWFGGAS
jgi:hypothetical protein